MMSLSVLTARCDGRRLDRLELRRRPGRPPRAPCRSLRRRAPSAGICASSTASAACVVPGTDASTRDRGCSSGIFLNSSGSVEGRERPRAAEAGRREPAARDRGNTPGPSRPCGTRRCRCCSPRAGWSCLDRQVVRLALQRGSVPAGVVVAKTFGASPRRDRLARAALPSTSFQLASFGSLPKLSGSAPARRSTGPAGPAPSARCPSPRRYKRLGRRVLGTDPSSC